jgi:hypothetical protein
MFARSDLAKALSHLGSAFANYNQPNIRRAIKQCQSALIVLERREKRIIRESLRNSQIDTSRQKSASETMGNEGVVNEGNQSFDTHHCDSG